ncbi:MAG: tRNA1(Val) (adenine(37)-N6)-methyltransferase [Alphaproteobacteria bacterium]
MSVRDRDFTEDGFLGGRVRVKQPREGYRAGHDSVLLAAAVPAKAGERIVELGSGVGVASLCLAARVPGCNVLGMEIDPALVALAVENARHNEMDVRVHFIAGDVRELRPEGVPFDHVFFNPPFHPDTGQVSSHAARDRATRDTDDAVRTWTANASRLVKPGGTVTAIMRADRVDDFLGATGRSGIVVLPLLPTVGAPPKRIIVQLRTGDTAPLFTMPGFAMHEDHRATHGAEAVLRHAATLPLTRH